MTGSSPPHLADLVLVVVGGVETGADTDFEYFSLSAGHDLFALSVDGAAATGKVGHIGKHVAVVDLHQVLPRMAPVDGWSKA